MSTDNDNNLDTYKPEDVQTELRQVKFSQIRREPDRFAFREEGDFGDNAIKSLAEDIALHGQVTPLLVRQLPDDQYVNLDGHRRLAAIAMNIRDGVVGFADDILVSVNVIVSEASELAMVVRAVSSNVQRQSLTGEGRCRAVLRLKQLRLPEKQIALTVGVGDSTVARDLALGSDDAMMAHVRDKNVTATNGAILIKAAQDADRVGDFKDWLSHWVDRIQSAIEVEEMERAAQDEESLNPTERWPRRYMSAELVRTLKDQLLKGDPLEEPGFKFKARLKDEEGRQRVEVDALSIEVASATAEQLAKVYERCFDLAADLEPVVKQKFEAEKLRRELGTDAGGSKGRQRLRDLGLADLVEPLDESDDASEEVHGD